MFKIKEKICPRCKAQNMANSPVCNNCGQDIRDVKPTKKK